MRASVPASLGAYLLSTNNRQPLQLPLNIHDTDQEDHVLEVSLHADSSTGAFIDVVTISGR